MPGLAGETHMKRFTVVLTAATAILSGCAEMNQIAEGVSYGVRANLTGEDVVVGRIEVTSPISGYLTCFKGTPGGVLSRSPIASPSQGEGFPAIIMTKSGVVASGNCAELQKQGLMSSTEASTTGSATTDSDTSAKATVPVFALKDGDGNVIKNAPDNCRIIHVFDASGAFVKKRYLSRPEDFTLASKCETALHEQNSKAAKPDTANKKSAKGQ
jgi:hypothetical protein